MEYMLRLGYVVRGLLYGVIGLLALQVVMGVGGRFTDAQGAIAFIGQSALGNILLYAVLVGLIGYGLWGLIRAAVDPLHKGTDTKGVLARVGYAVSGVSYLFLAFATWNLIKGQATAAHSGAQAAQTQQLAGSLMAKPWGVWVVALIGLIVIAAGLVQIYQGFSATFDRQYNAYALNSNQRKWMVRLGRFGVAARGVVFTLIGIFLFLAAYKHDPSQAQGIDGTLAALLHQPYGPLMLGIVALGLIAFGLYSALSGVWLRLKR
jgi:hypothetical protein